MKHEPVMTMATAIATIWTLILALSAWAGVTVPTEVQAAMVPAIIAAFWLVRQHVTPNVRPRTRDGIDLIPDPAQTDDDGMVDHG